MAGAWGAAWGRAWRAAWGARPAGAFVPAPGRTHIIDASLPDALIPGGQRQAPAAMAAPPVPLPAGDRVAGLAPGGAAMIAAPSARVAASAAGTRTAPVPAAAAAAVAGGSRSWRVHRSGAS